MKQITNEEFSDRLEAMVARMSAAQILSYGNVHAELSEALNNDIIEEWEKEQAIKAATIEDTEANGPEEDDITTSDHQVWYQYGKTYLFGSVADLKAKMDADRFWPNVWFISDHGNPHLVDLNS